MSRVRKSSLENCKRSSVGGINDVCGIRRVGGQRRKVSEEVGVAVAENGSAFEELLQRRDRDEYDRHRTQRAVVK